MANGFDTAGTSRIQAILGVAIFLIGALSFGPMILSARSAQEAEARAEAQAQTSGYSMEWVVDPEHPGGVKLAPRSSGDPDTPGDSVANSR